MADNKYNKKLEQAPYDAGRSTPKYPWVTGSADINGATTTTYANPDSFEESFTENFHHSASFDINENADDTKKGLRNSLKHESRNYNSGGDSSTSDGHSDRANLEAKGSLRENFAGDRGQSAKGNVYSGAGETNIGGAASGGYNHSSGDSYEVTEGDRTSQHTGKTSTDHTGDKVDNVTGNKMTMVKGEFGINIQGGNMDIQVDSGKFRVKSGAKLTIESGVEIEILVGGSSINITGSKITITSAGAVDIDATGDIKTQGATTKVQGGGATSVPTTFV